jgi:hypothetical protein
MICYQDQKKKDTHNIKCFVCDQIYADYKYIYTYHDHYDFLCMDSPSRGYNSINNTCYKCTELYTLPWSLFCNKSILPYKSLDSAMNHRELKPLGFYSGIVNENSILSKIPKDVILLIIFVYRDIRSL